ncbi:MAG: peptidase MA family metallohydrolase [Chloroflexota bacterium]|nr:peptidase MA family metallohydrolase [Chloroflexota bacterium]MDQ6905564.1 peptidase MA family metallohydrolase [Chloroflexota bacterium]
MNRRRIFIVPLMLCLLASPASAVLSPIGAAATPVTVSASTATPHFPQNIAFHLEANAASGEITALNLLYHAANTPVTKRVRVPVERGQRIGLDYALDTQTDFLAPGLDIEYRWAFTLSDGTQYRTDPAMLFYMDDQQQWKKKTSGPITLWWYSGDDAFGQDAIDTATRAADTLKKNFNVTSDRPIRILMYANARDLRVALPPNSAEWIGGGASTELGIIHAAIAPGRSAASEIRRILPHEMSHMVVYQASLNPYNHPPLWLDEGLAVHNQETPDVRFRPLVRDAADNGKLIPIRALNSPFPLSAEQALLSYAESESVVNFIITAYGSKYIGALVSAFKDELSYDQVVQKVLKESIEDLDKEWKASLNYGGDQGGITG